MAWVRMLRKPAAEIEAMDLDGKPVKLSDFRGKVVVLAFWSSAQDPKHELMHELIEVYQELKGQPLEILAVHDASLTSRESRVKVVAKVRRQFPGEIPIRLLFDGPPLGKSTRGFAASTGEVGSGRVEQETFTKRRII
jgi:hypothetical protein